MSWRKVDVMSAICEQCEEEYEVGDSDSYFPEHFCSEECEVLYDIEREER